MYSIPRLFVLELTILAGFDNQLYKVILEFIFKATAVDVSNKTVTFQDGSSVPYTSLVIATGGRYVCNTGSNTGNKQRHIFATNIVPFNK